MTRFGYVPAGDLTDEPDRPPGHLVAGDRGPLPPGVSTPPPLPPPSPYVRVMLAWDRAFSLAGWRLSPRLELALIRLAQGGHWAALVAVGARWRARHVKPRKAATAERVACLDCAGAPHSAGPAARRRAVIPP